MPFVGNKIDLQALLNKKRRVYRPYWKHGFRDDITLEGRMDSLRNIGLNKLNYLGLNDYAAIVLRIGDKAEGVKNTGTIVCSTPQRLFNYSQSGYRL